MSIIRTPSERVSGILEHLSPPDREALAKALLDQMMHERTQRQSQREMIREQNLFTAACAAMTGLLASDVNDTPANFVARSVQCAEALLAELDKRREVKS